MQHYRHNSGLWLFSLLVALTVSGCDVGPITVTTEQAPGFAQSQQQAKVVFISGRDSHGPGAHEHKAGAQLLASALRQRQPGIETTLVHGGWPADESVLRTADALILYCDGGKKHLINDHLDTFNQLLEEGVAVIALHYCVEVPRGSPAAAAMLAAIGGYFETDWSVNPHWEAQYSNLPQHAITREITAFNMLDEWYFNMRFVADMQGVTPILSAVAPPHTMSRRNGPHSGNDKVRELVARQVPQVTAWAYERQGGGRGFGYTGGHFHANWDNDNARNLVLNAIEWSVELPQK